MNKTRFYKLLAPWLVAWLVAWLPLTGAMASVMPIYGSAPMFVGGQENAMAKAADASEADTFMAAMPCHASSTTDGEAAKSPSCPHCVLCHIAGAIVPPSIPVVPMAHSHDCPTSLGVVSFTSVVPALLQRPPSDIRSD